MSLITENYQLNKLTKENINIKTHYKVKDQILEKNTDNSKNDEIIEGIILDKEYYKDNKLLYSIKNFDPRIIYSFTTNTNKKEMICINCGMHGSIDSFINGCPYCKTAYNIDYVDKELANKYHYDAIINSSIYKKITLLIDIILSFLIVFIYIYTTSRTFNIFDISKIIVGTILIAGILYYLFYLIDGYIVLLPIKLYKKRKNKEHQNFWNKSKFSKKTFYNNLNYELKKYYYTQSNKIIDFDIIDYLSFKKIETKDNIDIEVELDIRLIKFENDKIIEERKKEKILLRKNNTVLKLTENSNNIKCPNCGSSIDITIGECSYCKSKINYFQEWYIISKHE